MGRPDRHPGSGGKLLDHLRTGRLLQDHQVRITRLDHRGEGADPADSTVADVVGQEPHSRVLDFAQEREVRLSHDVLAEEHHPVPRALDVHRPADHLHQPPAQGRPPASFMSGRTHPRI